MKLKNCLAALFIVTIAHCFANNVDSLKQIAFSSNQDTNNVLALLELNNTYSKENKDTAIIYAQKAIALADKLSFSFGVSKGYRRLGWTYVNHGEYQNALTNFFEGLKVDEKRNDIEAVADDYLNIGVVYYYMQNPKVVTYWKKSAESYGIIGDKSSVATVYTNMAAYFRTQQQYDSALVYAQSALNTFMDLKDDLGTARTLVNIGNIYVSFEDEDEETLTKEERRLCQKALDSYEKALAYETVMDSATVATIYLNIGETNNHLGNYNKALDFIRKSLNRYEIMNDKEGIKQCYQNFSSVYRAQKKYELAIVYADSVQMLEHSLRSIAAEEAMAEMETKYQSEKKEQENQLLKKTNDLQKAENDRAKIWNIAMAGGILTMILIAGLIFYQFRAKKKANALLNAQNEEIKSQNEEILSQRDFIENQNVQLASKNKHIMSSIEYAKRIQEAILPSDELIIGNLPESFVLYKPKDIVSGDFYWMEAIESLVLWAAVDCTGHGVPGAFMSMLGANGLKKIVMERKVYRPSEILEHLTEHVVNSIKATKEGEEVKDGMDISLCCWDKSTNTLEWAGAYNPLLILREKAIPELEGSAKLYPLNLENPSDGGGLYEIKATKRPIGRFGRRNLPDFQNHTIKLEKGDCIYVFTDGLADQFGGMEGTKLTNKRMRDLLIENRQLEMEEQMTLLDNLFYEWKGNIEQLDDICIFGVRV